MKNYITISFLLFYLAFNAKTFDDSTQIDTLSIIFKAKLLTLSQYDYDSKNKYLNYIDSLKYEVFASKEFIFIKVSGNYFCQDKNQLITTNWCECDFYLCYSTKKNFFYKLGGFSTDNISEFSKEYYGSTFMTNFQFKISDLKLNEFIDLMNRKKLKNARKHFLKCTDKMP